MKRERKNLTGITNLSARTDEGNSSQTPTLKKIPQTIFQRAETNIQSPLQDSNARNIPLRATWSNQTPTTDTFETTHLTEFSVDARTKDKYGPKEATSETFSKKIKENPTRDSLKLQAIEKLRMISKEHYGNMAKMMKAFRKVHGDTITPQEFAAHLHRTKLDAYISTTEQDLVFEYFLEKNKSSSDGDSISSTGFSKGSGVGGGGGSMGSGGTPRVAVTDILARVDVADSNDPKIVAAKKDMINVRNFLAEKVAERRAQMESKRKNSVPNLDESTWQLTDAAKAKGVENEDDLMKRAIGQRTFDIDVDAEELNEMIEELYHTRQENGEHDMYVRYLRHTNLKLHEIPFYDMRLEELKNFKIRAATLEEFRNSPAVIGRLNELHEKKQKAAQFEREMELKRSLERKRERDERMGIVSDGSHPLGASLYAGAGAGRAGGAGGAGARTGGFSTRHEKTHVSVLGTMANSITGDGDFGSVTTTIGTISTKGNQPSHLKNAKTSRSPMGRGLFKPRLDEAYGDDRGEDEQGDMGEEGDDGNVTSSLSLSLSSASIVPRKPRKLVGLSALQNKSPLSPSGVVLRREEEERNEGPGRDEGLSRTTPQQNTGLGVGGGGGVGVGLGSVSSYGVDATATTTTSSSWVSVSHDAHSHAHTYDQSHAADFYPRVINAARTKVRDPTSLLVLRPQYEHEEPKYSCGRRIQPRDATDWSRVGYGGDSGTYSVDSQYTTTSSEYFPPIIYEPSKPITRNLISDADKDAAKRESRRLARVRKTEGSMKETISRVESDLLDKQVKELRRCQRINEDLIKYQTQILLNDVKEYRLLPLNMMLRKPFLSKSDKMWGGQMQTKDLKEDRNFSTTYGSSFDSKVLKLSDTHNIEGWQPHSPF